MKISTYQKQDGKTYYKVQGYLGTCPSTGKQKHVSRSGFTTEREAKKEFARLLHAFESGEFNQSTTFEASSTYETLYHDWLPLYKETVKDSTFFKTEFTFERHILPVFGKMKLKEITLLEAQGAVNEWSKNFANFSVMKSYASRVIQHGIRLGLVENNPFDLVIMPKRKKKDIEEVEKNFYTREELKGFLEALKKDHHMWYPFFWLLAYTGIRKGEALALKWSDLDIVNNTLSITKTIALGEGYQQIIQSPKTASGKRIINLDKATVHLLRVWSMKQNKLLSGFGFPCRGDGLMFSTNSNELLTLSAPTNYLQNFYKKYPKMKRITTHGLRHTHCSLLFEAGASVKEVQDRLGHSDIHTTMNIYAHVTQGKKEETAELFMNFMIG